MRVDVVSIFPEYLRALDLSLPGKAQERGILDLRVHDLRQWTHDRHRTVDDTPYGGGAGMVMRPEPWGEALDALLEEAPTAPVLIVPTPAGRPFSQSMAAELATEEHLVVACGRYEGIDQRVMDHAATQLRVVEVSVGDYVLNGGEAAALVVLEAVVRLLPGVLGNAASLDEESHTVTGLLEHPVFTKPPHWRGLDVPPVLLSGDHARITAWRRAQAEQRTAQRRPDLLHASGALSVAGGGPDRGEWRPAVPGDAGELFTLMRACWLDVALEHGDWRIPPLLESHDDVVAGLRNHLTFVLRVGGRLVASGRGRMGDGSEGGHDSAAPHEWHISRLMVAPDLRGRGLGRWVLEQLEAAAPPEATAYALVTGPRSRGNLRRYRRAGYVPDRQGSTRDFVRLVKQRQPLTG